MVEGSQTEIGEGVSTIVSFILYNQFHEDVTDKYDVEYLNGSLRVYAAQNKLTVHVYKLEKTYDGTPLSYDPDHWYGMQGLPEGYTCQLEISGSITNVGILYLDEIEYTLKVYDPDGIDVTVNFYVEFKGTPMTINRRPITLMSASEKRPYDEENPLTNSTVTISQGSLVDGHRYSARAVGKLEAPGTTVNTIYKDGVKIVDGSGQDVTANYTLQYIEGVLEFIE